MPLPLHVRLPIYLFGLAASIGLLTIAGVSFSLSLPIAVLRIVVAQLIFTAWWRRTRSS
jgi:hypothetical protein